MSPDVPRIDTPSPVTDVPIVENRPEARRIDALWPLRNLHSVHDGDGIEYAVLTVTHSASRRAYGASLNRQARFAGVVRVAPFDAAPVGRLTPTGRFSQKSLDAAFAAALQTLRDEISAGDRQLAAFFNPSDTEQSQPGSA
jgi:hypothetical protein